MTLDSRPSDKELLRRLAEKQSAVLVRVDPRVPAGQVVLMHGEQIVGTIKDLDLSTKPIWWDPRMNFTEQSYAAELESRRSWGRVRSWKYEPFSMRLAPHTYYRPDFLVQPSEQARLEVHEVKGFWRDDARAKFKIAAALYPMFVFHAVRRVEGVFQVIETLND